MAGDNQELLVKTRPIFTNHNSFYFNTMSTNISNQANYEIPATFNEFYKLNDNENRITRREQSKINENIFYSTNLSTISNSTNQLNNFNNHLQKFQLFNHVLDSSTECNNKIELNSVKLNQLDLDQTLLNDCQTRTTTNNLLNNVSRNWVLRKSSEGLNQIKKSLKCLKKLGSNGQQLNVSNIYEETDQFSSFYCSNFDSNDEFKDKNNLIGERIKNREQKETNLSTSCPSLIDQKLLLNHKNKEFNNTQNGDLKSIKTNVNFKKLSTCQQIKSTKTSTLVKNHQYKCYSNHYQKKKLKMGDLCGKSMSQSASSMSIKQPEIQKTEIQKRVNKNDKKTEENNIKSLSEIDNDANNNNTGSVKILVNDITPSNSQEFLLQKRNSTRSSQTTSPIHKHVLMQQSRSTNDLNNLDNQLTKDELIKQESQTLTKEESNSSICQCTASNQLNLNKHKTRRRKSWSYSYSGELPSINIQFIDQNVQQIKQTNENNQIKDTFNQINSKLEQCLDQQTNDQLNKIASQQLSESEGEDSTNNLQKQQQTKNQEQHKQQLDHKNYSSNLASAASSASSSLYGLESNLINENDDKKQFNNQLTNQQWHEKPRSLSASSGETFYYKQQHICEQHLTNKEHTSSNYHYKQKLNSANQSPCCCCYNTEANISYSRSNSGSSSHDSISASQLSVSTSTAAISSIGSILSTTPNFQNNNQLNQSNIPQNSQLTTTQVTLVQSINQQKITTSIISSTTQSTTISKSPSEQRSRSATSCLYTITDDLKSSSLNSDCQQKQKISQQQLQPLQTQTALANQQQQLNQQSIQRISPPVCKPVSLTKSDQSTIRHAKSQKQSRRLSNNRLANETTTEIQNQRSMRNRNLILQHQLHKSISTPTLIAHEEQTQNQSNERSSALSKIKNKLSGNSSNSNISALKVGTTNLFFTVRDKLKNENLALTCAPESDDDRSGAKPKKRASSLFFRKKKNKDKDTGRKSAHQFVSISYSIAAQCDVCHKSLANKSVLHCSNCLITVHDSSCKDQILDCNRFSLAKKPNQLTLQVPGSTGNLSNIGKTVGNSSPTHQRENLISSPLNASVSSLSNAVNQMTNVKQTIETGSAGYSTPLGNLTPATSPSSSYAQLHPSSSISLNPSTSSFRKGHHQSASIGSFSSSDSSCSIQSKTNASLSPSISRKSYTPSAYSQWRRVATKLGVNKVICEDKEAELNEDNASIIVEVNSTSSESTHESLEEDHLAFSSLILDDDQLLKLSEEEPASWSSNIQPNLLKNTKEKEIKRQEAIYELIITEKHHCLTMKIMQKIYAEGMLREGLSKDDVDRMFPCLEQLLELHLAFLRRLRERQAKSEFISNISDILLVFFSGKNAEKLRNYYGQFCSQHKEAVFLYKDYLKDRKFQSFIKSCLSKPFCKARGIQECLLLVTQRISKYPLIIESLIKLDKTLSKQLSLQLNQDEQTKETEKLLKTEIIELDQCYVNVRQIIFNVDDQVAEKEREHRLLKIYNKIDAKSTATVNGKKFRKSDLLSDKRKLCFETLCTYRNPHSKTTKSSIDCLLIILSDVIVFLQENNQKYYFAPIDNKSSVISLQNLIVREKAGQSSKGIFLISTNKNKEEMYELHFSTIKDQKQLIGQLNYTIALNQFESTNNEIPLTDNALLAWRLGIASPACSRLNRRLELNELVNELHLKDKELSRICEEKIRLLGELLEMQGIVSVSESTANFADTLQLISYSNLLNDTCSQETLISAANEAYRIVQNLYLTGCNSLSRSASSVGEHQTDQFINAPILLPKRAETFGGFDHNAAALARLLQKFTTSTNNVLESNNVNISTTSAATITTSTTNAILDKLEVKTKEDQLDKNLDVKDNELIKKTNEQIIASQKQIEIDDKKTDLKDSPAILVNTVLPIQDPNDNLSTLQLLVNQFEHNRGNVDSELSITIPQSKHDQIIQIVELQHQLNLLLCLFHHQQTLFELMRLNLKDNSTATNVSNIQSQQQTQSSTFTNTLSATRTISISPSTSSSTAMHLNTTLPTSLNKFRPENQLEELRNLHEQFSAEKQSFEKRTRELDKREEMLKQEKEDLKEQRENLYRKLENIQDELGICMMSSGGLPASAKLANLQASLNIVSKNDNNLKSTDQNKPSVRNRLSSGDLHVRQQLPLKLATGENASQLISKSCNSSPNISPSFDPVHCLQINKKLSISSSKSVTTPSSPKSVSRKESNQSSSSQQEQQTKDDKNEEEIFC